jgi:hypothetical protein
MKLSIFLFYGFLACANAFSGTADTTQNEPYLAVASAMNYKNDIGIISNFGSERAVSFRHWFSDSVAVQATAGENDQHRIRINLTGIRSYKRITYLRFIGFSTMRYEERNPYYFMFGLGTGLEYYIGRLGQAITYSIIANPSIISTGFGFSMNYRF